MIYRCEPTRGFLQATRSAVLVAAVFCTFLITTPKPGWVGAVGVIGRVSLMCLWGALLCLRLALAVGTVREVFSSCSRCRKRLVYGETWDPSHANVCCQCEGH